MHQISCHVIFVCTAQAVQVHITDPKSSHALNIIADQETPTSDFESFGGLSPEEGDTPILSLQPITPRFRVKVVEAVKQRTHILFGIETAEGDEKPKKVNRDYEDFQWLHHCLFGSLEIAGIVVPPLPEIPALSDNDYIGDGSSETVIKMQHHPGCKALEKYLRSLVSHHILGRYQSLEAFLLNEEPPYRYKVKKGLLGKITSAVDLSRKGAHKDIDDFFQKERDKSLKYNTDVKRVNQSYRRVLVSEKKIVSAYGHLITTLNMGASYQLRDTNNRKSNRLLVTFGEVLQGIKEAEETSLRNDETLMGFYWSYSVQYADALKEMLYRRTCLMIGYEEANRTLSKAKPQKQDEAEEMKIQAERAFDQCSEMARREISMFHHERLTAFQDALIAYVETKLKTAQDMYTEISKSLVMFKQLQM